MLLLLAQTSHLGFELLLSPLLFAQFGTTLAFGFLLGLYRLHVACGQFQFFDSQLLVLPCDAQVDELPESIDSVGTPVESGYRCLQIAGLDRFHAVLGFGVIEAESHAGHVVEEFPALCRRVVEGEIRRYVDRGLVLDMLFLRLSIDR